MYDKTVYRSQKSPRAATPAKHKASKSFRKSASTAAPGASAPFKDVPADLLQQILVRVKVRESLSTLPLVCRTWEQSLKPAFETIKLLGLHHRKTIDEAKPFWADYVRPTVVQYTHHQLEHRQSQLTDLEVTKLSNHGIAEHFSAGRSDMIRILRSPFVICGLNFENWKSMQEANASSPLKWVLPLLAFHPQSRNLCVRDVTLGKVRGEAKSWLTRLPSTDDWNSLYKELVQDPTNDSNTAKQSNTIRAGEAMFNHLLFGAFTFALKNSAMIEFAKSKLSLEGFISHAVTCLKLAEKRNYANCKPLMEALAGKLIAFTRDKYGTDADWKNVAAAVSHVCEYYGHLCTIPPEENTDQHRYDAQDALSKIGRNMEELVLAIPVGQLKERDAVIRPVMVYLKTGYTSVLSNKSIKLRGIYKDVQKMARENNWLPANYLKYVSIGSVAIENHCSNLSIQRQEQTW